MPQHDALWLTAGSNQDGYSNGSHIKETLPPKMAELLIASRWIGNIMTSVIFWNKEAFFFHKRWRVWIGGGVWFLPCTTKLKRKSSTKKSKFKHHLLALEASAMHGLLFEDRGVHSGFNLCPCLVQRIKGAGWTHYSHITLCSVCLHLQTRPIALDWHSVFFIPFRKVQVLLRPWDTYYLLQYSQMRSKFQQ